MCGFCGSLYFTENQTVEHIMRDHSPKHTKENKMPEGQGKRDKIRPRHDLIPIEFLDELASIFEEGLSKYGGDSWKKGGTEFLTDCLNHASNHLHLYMNGDKSENQLAKVAWNCLAVRWHELRNASNPEKM